MNRSIEEEDPIIQHLYDHDRLLRRKPPPYGHFLHIYLSKPKKTTVKPVILISPTITMCPIITSVTTYNNVSNNNPLYNNVSNNTPDNNVSNNNSPITMCPIITPL